ncbi:uncharacterized protein BXZ73DRAFT_82687 [Epithele typhae]|uniref:uncharacterized protein n=1 Tax=Epithele typhae TaxID=378194 RepID=UPI0020087AC6|nr:uncharacterized protein BXZ73DRAFT_82687 [Epithele typhae]KAH9911617.1 hypothetical protein BXZ73DRAFT_82687 [Epithele typhae]
MPQLPALPERQIVAVVWTSLDPQRISIAVNPPLIQISQITALIEILKYDTQVDIWDGNWVRKTIITDTIEIEDTTRAILARKTTVGKCRGLGSEIAAWERSWNPGRPAMLAHVCLGSKGPIGTMVVAWLEPDKTAHPYLIFVGQTSGLPFGAFLHLCLEQVSATATTTAPLRPTAGMGCQIQFWHPQISTWVQASAESPAPKGPIILIRNSANAWARDAGYMMQQWEMANPQYLAEQSQTEVPGFPLLIRSISNLMAKQGEDILAPLEAEALGGMAGRLSRIKDEPSNAENLLSANQEFLQADAEMDVELGQSTPFVQPYHIPEGVSFEEFLRQSIDDY